MGALCQLLQFQEDLQSRLLRQFTKLLALICMVRTRTRLNLSKLSIHQVISDQREEEQVTQSSMSNHNNKMDDLYNTNASCQSIKADSSITDISCLSFISINATEIKMAVLPELDNQTLKTIMTLLPIQSTNHSINNKEDKVLVRIPYYNRKTNIYVWLTAIKSVFMNLEYYESI
ncbi:unnamed protein product [Rotaria sp. Silwood2]|nr:unnamed protein product [Rotaria sp. Silwood2]CAF2947392.1 unnamed protein product [Rotaria sp. Silwood2]CAF3161176.1 unnamed protein product [Rotaria sp. Silwood2]CAF3292891.1 unnamed protein product [Rotaria sp. Silwood2]CAF3960790.1 unnamed protein product [Rotaria sp. Silwood2]